MRIDDTYVDEALSEHCGFPVQVHLEAKIIFNYSRQLGFR
jgi:hypothetical protein